MTNPKTILQLLGQVATLVKQSPARNKPRSSLFAGNAYERRLPQAETIDDSIDHLQGLVNALTADFSAVKQYNVEMDSLVTKDRYEGFLDGTIELLELHQRMLCPNQGLYAPNTFERGALANVLTTLHAASTMFAYAYDVTQKKQAGYQRLANEIIKTYAELLHPQDRVMFSRLPIAEQFEYAHIVFQEEISYNPEFLEPIIPTVLDQYWQTAAMKSAELMHTVDELNTRKDPDLAISSARGQLVAIAKHACKHSANVSKTLHAYRDTQIYVPLFNHS